MGRAQAARYPQRLPLYSPEERRRRDASVWTLVQGILAPLQFAVFLLSLALVVRFLWTGEGYAAATLSILAKTGLLYLIMVTGAIWEKAVFGRYLFAPAFFWEDVVSMAVIALHTLYIAALLWPSVSAERQMLIALAAYAAYVVNAAQFLLKLRAARLEQESRGLAAAPEELSDDVHGDLPNVAGAGVAR
jgi:3-vinyl bacteriochlorophyllide hydratase